MATEIAPLKVRIDGHEVPIEQLKIDFPLGEDRAQVREVRLRLVRQHRTKSLVVAEGKLTFGELAVLGCLNSDGWDGVWIDDYCRCFREELPYADAKPVTLPPPAQKLYDRIVTANGNREFSGFFDVFAWRKGEYVFVEYKGRTDTLKRTQREWIKAALTTGVEPRQLAFVTWRIPIPVEDP